MATLVRMPAALAGVTEAAIQTWLAEPGSAVTAGQPIAEIETEKAVVEYAAETEGTLARVLVEPGANVAVGTPIAVILAPGEDASAADAAIESAPDAGAETESAPDAGAETAPEPDVAETPAPPEPETAPAAGLEQPSAPGARLFASPIVRRLARERGIDLGAVTGSGPGGRIVRRDLDTVATPPATPSSAPSSGASSGGVTEVPLTPMRRAIARRLTESKSTVPHFYVTAHCRVDRLLALRREVNEGAPRKISVNDFVLKAVAGALREVPDANAIWGGDRVLRFDGVDIGVAVAVDGGLLTPVVRRVDRLTLGALGATVAGLAERARIGRLKQDELEGGSFAVSNLGMYGVDEFSAILNPPQSGILAVAAAKPQPVVGADGVSLEVGTVMTVTLSADHRVVDGALAAEWMAAFRRRIEHPLTMLI